MGESSELALAFATGFVGLAVYEWAALRFRRVPTVTDIVKANLYVRAGVTVLVILAWIDHFWTGLVL